MRILTSLILAGLLTLTTAAQAPQQQIMLGTPPASSGPTGTAFILTQTVGTLRNDFTGCVGFIFATTATPTVTALGRWVVSGNSGSHTVYLLDTGSNTVVASVAINTSGATPGQYKYASVTPVMLSSANNYVLCSAETNTGDQWYGDDTTINSTSAGVGAIIGAEGSTSTPPANANNFPGAVGQFSYGPVNFLF